MKAIIAVNNLGYIGKDNVLFWRSADDLQHFKKMTDGSGKVLVCGYNTYQTLPMVVKKRAMVYCDEGDTRIIDIIENHNDEIDLYCIGGKKTYEKYAKYFTELHISHIDHNGIGDVMFPDLSSLNQDCKIYNYYFKSV